MVGDAGRDAGRTLYVRERSAPAHPLLIVFALWLLVFSASSQTMVIAPILPLIGEELGIADAWLGSLVTVYSLMVGVMAVISGPISDRVGRRRILLLGSGAMTCALALHTFVGSYAEFAVVRVLSGAAGGVLSGAAVSYIGDYFPYKRRGWATGWVMSGSAVGLIIGIPVGVLLAGEFGFRSPFYFFGVMMALTFLLVYTRVPQPPVKRRRSRLTVNRAIAGYVVMLRRPEIAFAALAFFSVSFGVSLFVVYFPTWLEAFHDATPEQIASLFLVAGVANVIAGPQAGRLSDRVGRKVMVIASCLGLSTVMIATVPLITTLWVAYPLYALMMVLIATRTSPYSALLTALVPANRRGSLMSLTVALGQVGFALGAMVAGYFYSTWGFAGNTVVGAVAVLCMGWIVWTKLSEPDGE